MENISFNELFERSIFRIPDYQRGYAWGKQQWVDFWEDLINLADGRTHYTGLITLKEKSITDKSDNLYWLQDELNYRLYEVVDGQQRLTTLMLFISAFIDFIQGLPENANKSDDAIFIGERSAYEVKQAFILKASKSDSLVRSFIFGYTEDNPSDDFFRHRILGEPGGGHLQETFYTLNLQKGTAFFYEQLCALYETADISALNAIFKKVTSRLTVLKYVISDEFDVHVAFETMNNRGKKLSDLELLKNRLIYLIELLQLKPDETATLLKSVNDAWKEIYAQLGRNPKRPLNDDDFLKAHWILYFKFSRQRGNDYIRFLLDKQFTPKRVYQLTAKEVEIDDAETVSEEDPDAVDADILPEESDKLSNAGSITANDLMNYSISLKDCAPHWFASFFPFEAKLPKEEAVCVDRLNRLGMGYFRPLVMAVLKNDLHTVEKVQLFSAIERFIFLTMKLDSARSNYGSSWFSNVVREFDQGKKHASDIIKELEGRQDYLFSEDGYFDSKGTFLKKLAPLFSDRHQHKGFYAWNGLHYFLFEYEQHLLQLGHYKHDLTWDSFVKPNSGGKSDMISIEHIYPQNPDEGWAKFKCKRNNKASVHGSLGNLLLLSKSMNSKLQNHSFEIKKKGKQDKDENKARIGFQNGSRSEQEVAAVKDWSDDEIKKRGMKMLSFMEERWDIQMTEEDKEALLFLK